MPIIEATNLPLPAFEANNRAKRRRRMKESAAAMSRDILASKSMGSHRGMSRRERRHIAWATVKSEARDVNS